MTRTSRNAWAAESGLLVAAAFVVCGAFRVLVGHPSTWPPVLIAAAAGAVAGAAGAAVPALRPFGGRVLRATFMAAGVVTLVLLTYLVVVAGIGGTPHGNERRVLALSMVAAVVALLLAEPVRARLGDVVARWGPQEQQAPTTALATFGARMTRAVPMDELLLQLAETLRDTIAPAGAEIWTGADGTLDLAVSVPDRTRPRLVLDPEAAGVVARTRAAGGSWIGVWLPALLEDRGALQLRVAPIAHLGELLGLIVISSSATEPAYDDEVDGMLADLARQVGLALHNVRLDSALQASLAELQQRNVELQASRARIVAASDESRRRIERDLHDGAQQHLVALAVKLGLTRQVLGEASPPTSTLLEELRSDVQATIDAVRELAHGIYPPLLRDRGIAEALRTAGARCPLPVEVQVSTAARYPAEAEAAVYFCCLEALQNAGKHAGAAATVRIRVDADTDGLRFEVNDDGVGFDLGAPGGHGFTNMADRLGAIGGRLGVTSAPGAGTTISGVVPCAALPAPAPAQPA